MSIQYALTSYQGIELTLIISFNLYINSKSLKYNYSHITEEETEAKKVPKVTLRYL
jgi:hypothetical protein